MVQDNSKSFNPSDHLTKIGNELYLTVKWRLAWLRRQHPNAIVDSQLVARDEGFALFKAMVTIPDGGSATGWGSETASDFGDFIEKAETKAIGRALAALGFGTQFCDDFDEGGAVADAPVARQPAGRTPRQPKRATASENGKITEAQSRAIHAILSGLYGPDERAQAETMQAICPKAVEGTQIHTSGLTIKEASEVIGALQKRERQPTPSYEGYREKAQEEKPPVDPGFAPPGP